MIKKTLIEEDIQKIIELRDKHKKKFSEISEIMGFGRGVISRAYYTATGKPRGKPFENLYEKLNALIHINNELFLLIQEILSLVKKS